MARKKSTTPSTPLIYGIRPAPSIPTHITVAQGIDSRKWVEGGFWVPFISSNVSSAIYNGPDRELYVRFDSGRTWRYSEVPASVAEMMFNVNSPGRFEHRVLRKYSAIEITGQVVITIHDRSVTVHE